MVFILLIFFIVSDNGFRTRKGDDNEHVIHSSTGESFKAQQKGAIHLLSIIAKSYEFRCVEEGTRGSPDSLFFRQFLHLIAQQISSFR